MLSSVVSRLVSSAQAISTLMRAPLLHGLHLPTPTPISFKCPAVNVSAYDTDQEGGVTWLMGQTDTHR